MARERSKLDQAFDTELPEEGFRIQRKLIPRKIILEMVIAVLPETMRLFQDIQVDLEGFKRKIQRVLIKSSAPERRDEDPADAVLREHEAKKMSETAIEKGKLMGIGFSVATKVIERLMDDERIDIEIRAFLEKAGLASKAAKSHLPDSAALIDSLVSGELPSEPPPRTSSPYSFYERLWRGNCAHGSHYEFC